MQEPQRDISPERKAVYYIGMGLSVLGGILFISVFVTGALNFGNFNHFEERARGEGLRAVSGMVLIIVGGIVASVGRAGLAGSGLKMDPQGMRKDLEPWNRASGGMLNDTLEEANLPWHLGATGTPREVIKVRCAACGALNEESARFCNQCGKQLIG